MSTSPTPRRIEEVVLDATFGGAGTKVLTFARQTGPASALPAGPFNTDPNGATVSAQRGTVFPNLLAQPATDFQTQAGVVSAKFNGTTQSGGNVSVTKVQIVDKDGVVKATVMDDATGVKLNDTAIPALLGRIPCGAYEALRLTLVATAAAAGQAIARYDLGLNAQQPEVFSTPASL